MAFRRFVEIGRVCLVNYGEDTGKLVIVQDVVDTNKAYCVDFTGTQRKVITLKRLSLTDFTVPILRNTRTKGVVAAVAASGVEEKWAATAWAKRLASKKKRAANTDFDRFRLMIARKQKSRIVSKKMETLVKA